MHTVYIKIQIPHLKEYKVRGLIWRPWKRNGAEYIGVVRRLKGHFVSFKWVYNELCLN